MAAVDRCHAVLRIGGTDGALYGCELAPPHHGLAHLHIDERLGRIEWCSHEDAVWAEHANAKDARIAELEGVSLHE